MPIMVKRKKWIFYKHTCNLKLIEDFAQDIKYLCDSSVGKDQKRKLQIILHNQNHYNARGRKSNPPLDAILHRINTLKYWMFGHVLEGNDNRKENQRFIFSPLGNLFLKKLNEDIPNKDIVLAKIFLAMLFGLQFPTPANNVDPVFHLYPFRLIFKLLRDPRIGFRIYNKDVECILMFIQNVNQRSYEKLVNDILDLRKKSLSEVKRILLSDEHTYVNTVYEWEYYTISFLSSIAVLKETPGEFICKLYHPTKTGSHSKPTFRKATNGFVELNPNLISLCDILLSNYSPFANPVNLNDSDRITEDSVKEIYSFYPPELLESIGENPVFKRFADIAKCISLYSLNRENGDSDRFERVLCDGFNFFKNVSAQRIGKSGHTDIECLYKDSNRVEKFDVEAKSTENKLSLINSGRLRAHREEIGSKFTLVITPNYVPAVKEDIFDQPIVILLSNTFSEYLMNVVLEARDTDFTDLLNIIEANLGSDISEKVSALTFDRFGTRRLNDIVSNRSYSI